MNPSDEISAHAFVDGQLETEEYAAMLEALARDAELRARVCEIQRLKQLVRAAWPMPAPAALPPRRRPRSRPWYSLAASLLAAWAGWAGWQSLRTLPETGEPAVVTRANGSHAQHRILFHVATANPVAVDEMFNDLLYILKSDRDAGIPVLVEVIANGDGLNLLRVDTTRHAARIRELVREFPNVRFSACQNTMDRLKREEGIVVRLIPETGIIESGVAGVAQRQGEGWSYIRV
jgi:intracellular sulfur oxidation DsrE/DsrF family protein